MGIPEDVLARWSNDGATVTAKHTHHEIRRVLEAHSWPPGMYPHLFLQGSYANHTTIRSDSDVDLVVEMNSGFYCNDEVLTGRQLIYSGLKYPANLPSWVAFHDEVLRVLKREYGRSADPRTNAIKVTLGPGRLAADVVVCTSYRLYIPSPGMTTLPPYHQGIMFLADGVREVVNFPEQHLKNGEKKNHPTVTRERFKPMVRVFKNARRYMVERGRLADDIAPSYFIQCLLYNVPNHLFLGTHEQAFVGILNWLPKADLSTFWCQNGITRLFGDKPNEWTVSRATTYLHALVDLWNGWR